MKRFSLLFVVLFVMSLIMALSPAVEASTTRKMDGYTLWSIENVINRNPELKKILMETPGYRENFGIEKAAQFLYEIGKLDEAAKLYDQIGEGVDKDDFWNNFFEIAGDIMMEAENYSEAASFYYKQATRESYGCFAAKGPAIWLKTANAANLTNDYKASLHFDDYAWRAHDQGITYLTIGRAAEGIEMYDKAMYYFEKGGLFKDALRVAEENGFTAKVALYQGLID